MKLTAYTRIGNFGWEAYAFGLDDKTVSQTDLMLEVKSGDGYQTGTIHAVSTTERGVRIDVEPFNYHGDFRLTTPERVIARNDVHDVKTEWADRFDAKSENSVIYRLYSPAADGPRPLVLFLHGGGECGDDNWLQMTGTIGAARIAEDYPDVYVMAPQAPREPSSGPKITHPYQTNNKNPQYGWNRRYIALVCDIIRGMVADGRINPDRIVVTGMSNGGAGTLRALSVAGDLFAAAAPICPSMNPETFGILCSLTSTKLWISASYVDHFHYRHKYIVDGILALRDAGNREARLTIYSPEELEAYGIGTDQNLPLERRFAMNHQCWVLTFNNEYGIMSWLMSQSK